MKKSVIVLAIALMGVNTTSYSLNMGYLRYSPVSTYNQQDFDLLEKAGEQVLTNRADGEKEEWTNPETGNSGVITVIRSFERGGQQCRELKITNRSKNLQESNTYNHFCRQQDGSWKIPGSKHDQENSKVNQDNQENIK